MVLQPWAKTEFDALTRVDDRPARLRDEFGFNALILLPTEAHNALSGSPYYLSDSQFRRAVDAYRREGYRLILYSSVMHCGHAPVWQGGTLEREHPDWSQRDARGKPITEFGHAWLCPSSPARKYTLNYTIDIARSYSADGVMLDNNGFGHTENGWTCFCDFCQKAFRRYVLRRCGARWIQTQLGTEPAEIKIPLGPGVLFALWMHWRNRVWAEVNEAFRLSLRRVHPEIILFVNTQYDLPVNTQGINLQFQREDLVFSETHQTDLSYIAPKMIFGKSLARNVPLWNYAATFAETPDGAAIDQLRPPAVIRQVLAATLAYGARPWIVYFGLENPQSKPARREMARILSWSARHPELFSAKPFAPVATLVSLRERDLFDGSIRCVGQGVVGCDPIAAKTALIPRHLGPVLKSGVPAIALRESQLSPEALRPFRFVTVEPGKAMSREVVQILVAWVRAGGVLIASPDAGSYDELGRRLPQPLLLQTLRLKAGENRVKKFGRGKVLLPNAGEFTQDVLASLESSGAPFTVPAGMEVVCYRTATHNIIHFVQQESHEAAASIVFPEWLGTVSGPADWYSPDWNGSRPLAINQIGSRAGVIFPTTPLYSVLVFPAEKARETARADH